MKFTSTVRTCVSAFIAGSISITMIGPARAGIDEGSVSIPVPFVTDRKQLMESGDNEGAELSKVKMGVARITVPTQQKWFENGALKSSLSDLGWTYDNRTVDPIRPIQPEGYSTGPKPERLFSEDAKADFWKELESIEKRSHAKEVFVYIHGFAASGINAVYATGILASELEAPVVCFTWPSLGQVLPAMSRKFERDRRILEGDRVLADFDGFIRELVEKSGPDVKVSLIAHSLGNRLVTRQFEQEGRLPFKYRRVIFVSADVQKDRFEKIGSEVVSSAEYVAAYMSPKDRVLFGSKINGIFRERSLVGRLGKSKEFVAGMDFVDYTEIAEPRALKHYIPFDDLASMLNTDFPAKRADREEYTALRRVTIKKAQ